MALHEWIANEHQRMDMEARKRALEADQRARREREEAHRREHARERIERSPLVSVPKVVLEALEAIHEYDREGMAPRAYRDIVNEYLYGEDGPA